MLTIGVLITVPEPHGSFLRDRRREFGDSIADEIASHVTLLPPHEIEPDSLDDVGRRLTEAATTVEPFHMRLRGTGTFRPVSPVVFVAVSLGISETEILAWRLRRSVDLPDPELPFHPHVTVAQHLDDRALDRADAVLRGFECEFDVTEFGLYVHDDAGWEKSRTVSLGRSAT